MVDKNLNKFPIGKFILPKSFSKEELAEWIHEIHVLPGRLGAIVKNIETDQLEMSYRTDGWTVRQIVHHLADSHMNAILRFKWALTEDRPVIKPYDQQKWSLLADYELPVDSSINMLESVHIHFVTLLRSLKDEDWERSYINALTEEKTSLKKATALYAWHCNHHLNHIKMALKI